MKRYISSLYQAFTFSLAAVPQKQTETLNEYVQIRKRSKSEQNNSLNIFENGDIKRVTLQNLSPMNSAMAKKKERKKL
jgi:hypothetical protein